MPKDLPKIEFLDNIYFEPPWATAIRHENGAVAFSLTIPNDLVLEKMKRDGIHLRQGHSSKALEKASDPYVKKITGAVNTYLQTTFGPASKPVAVTCSFVASVKETAFYPYIRDRFIVSGTLVEDEQHKGMGNHLMGLFKGAPHGIDDKIDSPGDYAKIAGYPQTLDDLKAGINDAVYNALDFREGVKVAQRSEKAVRQ